MKRGEYLLKAGAGCAEILYTEEMFPLEEGYVGVHDVPCARVLLLECNGERFAIASVEIVNMAGGLETAAKEIISKICQLSMQHIWIVSTHSVSTPHIWPLSRLEKNGNQDEIRKRNRMFDAVESAVERAAQTAADGMRTARIGFGSGVCTANCNRVIPTCDGLWLGSGEERQSDHSVPVIRFEDEHQKAIALIYNYNCQQAVMDECYRAEGGRLVSADLSGTASRFVERELGGGVVALFLPGASGDQGPTYRACRTVRGKNGSYRTIDLHEQGYLILELLGERLGEQVLVAAEQTQCSELRAPIRMLGKNFSYAGQVAGETKRMRAVREWNYVSDGEKTSPVELLILGEDIVLVGVSVEACAKTEMNIKKRSPYPHTIFGSFVNGGTPVLPNRGIKYMAERELYEQISFQSRNSTFAIGSAERMEENVVGFLKEHYREKRQ